jgi:hypothetical protein
LASEGAALKGGITKEGDGVGEVIDRGEFGLGRAPKDSKPVNKIELTKEKEAEIDEAQRYEPWSERNIGSAKDDEAALLLAAKRKNAPKKRKIIEK